jgi:uncharacterized protein (DUF2236 family)
MNPLLFSPKSVFWRVNREFSTGLAGPRAVLMQIAHPLVAAGVAEHSRFRDHRLARLYRTSIAAASVTFGSRELAWRAVNSINRIHTRVHGVLGADVGRFSAGTPYDANDPELKLWVLSTITDSALRVYELFVSPLSTMERENYYRDSLILARMFDIPDSILPPDYSEFTSYMNDMLKNGSVRIGDDAKKIVAALFSRSAMGTLLFAGSAVGIGLLPEGLRNEFGLHWNPRRESCLRKSAALSTRLRRCLPSFLCSNPFATTSALLTMIRPDADPALQVR